MTYMARSRNIIFTLFNYNDKIIENLKQQAFTYLIFGKEHTKDGKEHLQGYIEFPEAIRWSTLINKFKGIHLEKRLGTAFQAAEYCKKEGKYEEYGEISKQGSRTDLKELAIIATQEGAKAVAIKMPDMYIKYHRGIKALICELYNDRNTMPKVTWLWGKTGCGKTRQAIEAHKSFYIKDDTKWWDKYEQQEAIILDDFSGNWEFRNLLRLLDRYPYLGEIKGGTIPINSPYIYITCEFPPEHYWTDSSLAQILRRVTVVTEVGG